MVRYPIINEQEIHLILRGTVKEFAAAKELMGQGDLIEQAREVHGQGELTAAEDLYRRVLARDPDDPDASHLLGVVFYQRGEYPAALELISRADRLRPDHPATLNNLGCVLRELGRHGEAILPLRKAVMLQADFAEAEINLGTVCRVLGRLAEAEAAYRRALALNPRDGKTLNNLGNLFLEKGECGAALDWYGRALALAPDAPLSQYNLGCALLKTGRHDEAEAALLQALKADPAMVKALHALGSLHQIRFEFPKAIATLQRAISLKPEEAESYVKLAETYFAMNLFREALNCLDRARALSPDSGKVHHRCAMVCQSQGKVVEAQESLDRALAIEPANPEVLYTQATLYMDQGLFAESAAVAREVLQRRPSFAPAWNQLALVARDGEKEEVARNIAAILEKSKASPLQRMQLDFALAGLLEDLGEHDRVFSLIAEANSLKRKMFRFSLEPQEMLINRICEVYNAEAVKRFSGRGWRSGVPIFILGMPRSGTTLTEQILSSHPAVYGGGELRLVHETVTDYLRIQPLADYTSPDIVLRARDLPELGRRYVERLRQLSPEARHITDKMPGNFLFLGLIALILPDARIIHCVRSPMDTCWSVYKKLFSHGHQYAYGLEELGRYYLLYRRLMEHWQRVLPGRFLEFCYEELVRDQEGQTRRLLEFCGLNWHPDCLHFERNRRPVHTASSTQVRQPLSNRSVGRWKRYEQGLRPLLDLLQHCQEAYSAKHHIP